jgi:glutaredoxin
MALSGLELRRAERELRSLEGSVSLVLLKNGDERLESEMEEFAQTLANLSDRIKLKVEKSSAHAPALAIEKAGRKAVVYRTLPTGKELKPFLETLKAAANEGSLPEVGLKLLNPEREVELLIFITSACPHCAKVVKRCNLLALREDWIKSEVVDALAEERLREEYEVTATPTLVVDGKLKLEGEASLGEIVDAIEAVVDKGKQREVVRHMLEKGLAEKAGEWAVHEEGIAEVLVDLIADQNMRVKIGAMLALEELFKAKPEMLEKLGKAFEKLLTHEKENVRGDAAWLIERAKKFI